MDDIKQTSLEPNFDILQFEIKVTPGDERKPKPKRIPKQQHVVGIDPDARAIEDHSLPVATIQSQDGAKNLYILVAALVHELKKFVSANCRPRVVYENLRTFLKTNLAHRDLIFGGVGILVGGLVGYWLTAALSGQPQAYICMQAVQCFRYSGVEGVSFVDNAAIPNECGKGEVLISVKAGSVNIVDVSICGGYGSLLRNILSKYFKYWKGDLPVTLGRNCTGIVLETGQGVTRLEIGDEVWLAAPYWAPGALSQYVLTPEYYVSKKPAKVGFESASSLPYAGGLALSVLEEASITPENASSKRILVHGGCSAVGCILVQILKAWGASVTVTCYERALPVAKALGSKDFIGLAVPESGAMYPNIDDQIKFLKKELDIREPYHAIICTTRCELSERELYSFCHANGMVISTLPETLASDSFGFFTGAIFSLYVRSKCFVTRVFSGRIGNFGEAHISHVELDRIAELVDKGEIHTVVDRLFQPYEIEQALLHIQSTDSIGSSVVTFR